MGMTVAGCGARAHDGSKPRPFVLRARAHAHRASMPAVRPAVLGMGTRIPPRMGRSGLSRRGAGGRIDPDPWPEGRGGAPQTTGAP